MPEHDCLPPDVSATEFVCHMARVSGLPIRRGTRANGRCPAPRGPVRGALPADRRLLDRHEAAREAGPGARPRPAAPLPRRADQRPRPRRPRRDAGAHRAHRPRVRDRRDRRQPPARRDRARRRPGWWPSTRAACCAPPRFESSPSRPASSSSRPRRTPTALAAAARDARHRPREPTAGSCWSTSPEPRRRLRRSTTRCATRPSTLRSGARPHRAATPSARGPVPARRGR